MKIWFMSNNVKIKIKKIKPIYKIDKYQQKIILRVLESKSENDKKNYNLNK